MFKVNNRNTLEQGVNIFKVNDKDKLLQEIKRNLGDKKKYLSSAQSSIQSK